jgi:hypothetical protein
MARLTEGGSSHVQVWQTPPPYGRIDWGKISEQETSDLAYAMFDATNAPREAIEEYFWSFYW